MAAPRFDRIFRLALYAPEPDLAAFARLSSGTCTCPRGVVQARVHAG